MPPQHDDTTHMDSAAAVIPKTDSRLSLNQATALCWVVSKMSLAKKNLAQKTFLELKIVRNRKKKLKTTLELIAQSMGNLQNFGASTKAAITRKSILTFKKNYTQYLLNSAKIGRTIVHDRVGDLQFDENKSCVANDNEIQEMKRRTRGSQTFRTILLWID